MKKIREKLKLHPIMSYLVLIAFVILLSGILSFIGIESNYKIFDKNGDTETKLVTVTSLLNLSGLKYIFSETVANFVAFTPLSNLIIILIGIGIMKKSGFLRCAFTLISKFCKKNVVTFLVVFISMVSSIMGDIGYVIMIPLSALLFYYGRRNPKIGIISSFAALTCGSGLSVFITSIDSSLLNLTLSSAHLLDPGYTINNLSFILIMSVAIVLLSLLITFITENYITNKFGPYTYKESDFKNITRRDLKGLIFGIGAGLIYLLFFIYNIIPGLPLSGALLDNTQVHYIDKLFSYNSFFSNGFVFIITMLFVILGLFYGIGARTIKNNKDVCEYFGHSLDGTGRTLVLILFASILISVFKKSEIGTVISALLANLIASSKFTSVPLIILLFLFSAISSIFSTSPILKWTVFSSTIVPTLMNAGISAEFAQVIFRFGECVTTGLTPLLAYFIIYLAWLEKYNQDDEHVGIFKSIRYIVPYSIFSGILLLILLVVWYIISLPLGISTSVAL